MKRRRNRCPHCGEEQGAYGIVFAAGILVGALLTALALAFPPGVAP